jgi:hypothetical protein
LNHFVRSWLAFTTWMTHPSTTAYSLTKQQTERAQPLPLPCSALSRLLIN